MQYCTICHDKKAPILTGVNHHDPLEAILIPDAQITEGYETLRFTLKDGNSDFGFIAEETETLIDVVDQTGTSLILQNEEIAFHQVVAYSTMPINLIDILSFQDVADLLGYLKSLAVLGVNSNEWVKPD